MGVTVFADFLYLPLCTVRARLVRTGVAATADARPRTCLCDTGWAYYADCSGRAATAPCRVHLLFSEEYSQVFVQLLLNGRQG